MELKGLRVLIVEDEGLVAMLIEDMLADLGCSVAATAGDITEALHKARAGGFEFAILDVNLHGKEVFPVAEVLSKERIPSLSQADMGPQDCRTHSGPRRSCQSLSNSRNFRPFSRPHLGNRDLVIPRVVDEHAKSPKSFRRSCSSPSRLAGWCSIVCPTISSPRRSRSRS